MSLYQKEAHGNDKIYYETTKCAALSAGLHFACVRMMRRSAPWNVGKNVYRVWLVITLRR